MTTTELDNTMTADFKGKKLIFDTDFGRADARRISLDAYVGKDIDGASVYLRISVAHYQRGEYTVSVDRHRTHGGFTSYRVVHDRYRAFRVVEGARYSSKKLEATAAYWFDKFMADETTLTKLVEWALEDVAEPAL